MSTRRWHALPTAALVALVALVALPACDRSSLPTARPDPQPTAPTAPTGKTGSAAPSPSLPPAPPANAKWACTADSDCMNSCSQGAVSSRWYAGAAVKECEDGCSSKGFEPPRCLGGECVAFVRDFAHAGKVVRSDECTHKP